MREKYKGLLALTFATFLGGAVMPAVIRAGVATIHPVIFTFFRTGFSGLISLLLINSYWSQLRQNWKNILPIMLLLGATMGGNILLFSIGVSHTTLIVSKLMYTILPITTGVVGFLWLKEKMPTQKIIGAIVAIVGVTILVIFSNQRDQQISLGTFYGNAVILSAVSCYTMYFIFSKKYSTSYPPLVMATLTNLGAALISLFPTTWLLWRSGLNQVSSASWWSVVLIALISTLFIFLVQYGLKRLSTVTSAVITQLSPEFAALTGIIFYQEKISLILFLSLILVTSGVTLSAQSEQNRLKDKFNWLINLCRKPFPKF